jgi:uncharacterized cupin superfamily protein
MSGLMKLPGAGDAPWEDVPADKVLAGAPQTRTWVLYDNPAQKLCAGEWEASPGKWRISYNEWEYVEVISGACIITGGDGTLIEAKAGDRFVIEPGFTGSWEVLSLMHKSWVIRE